jgi:hypothetical protein
VPRTSYSRKQFPIISAFAATIHKAQSATIDCVAIHLDNMKDHGQLYVAMSRVRHKENLFFFGVDLPVNTRKRFRVDWDANEIVIHNLKRGKMKFFSSMYITTLFLYATLKPQCNALIINTK